jgi:hypothetical protein
MVGLVMARPPKELLDLLKPYDRGVQELTVALRQLVLEELAPCCEYIVEVYIVSDRLTQGLFGAKAGWRARRLGVFGKARPGFVHFNETLIVCWVN